MNKPQFMNKSQPGVVFSGSDVPIEAKMKPGHQSLSEIVQHAPGSCWHSSL